MEHSFADLYGSELPVVGDSSRVQTLPRKALLYPAMIIPITLVGLISDQIFFGGYLRTTLPRNPEELAFFSFFFVYPHIVASLCVASNRHIRAGLGHVLVRASVAVMLLAVAVALALGDSALFIVYGLMTIYHVFAQQFSLARLFLARTNYHFKICFTVGMILSVGCYALVYSPKLALHAYFIPFIAIAVTLLVCSLPSFLALMRLARGWDGRWYLMTCLLTLISSWVCVVSDYPFGAILIPRVIHDLTAFLFYLSYEINSPDQTLAQKALGLILERGSIVRAVPLLSVSLAVASGVTFFEQERMGMYFVVAVGFLHYTVEHFLWRSESPARQYVKITE